MISSWRGIVQILQHKGFRIEGAVGYRARTAHRYWPMPRKRAVRRMIHVETLTQNRTTGYTPAKVKYTHA